MTPLHEAIEQYLNEAMRDASDVAKAGVYVATVATNGGRGRAFFYADENGDPSVSPVRGRVHILRPREGNAEGGWVVNGANADRGWGPLLYDVAMEWASINGGGIMPDRDLVSQDARNVWDAYFRSRSDVDKIQLDDQKNTLTPHDSDNAMQQLAKYHGDFPDGPLSQLYRKHGTPVIDELEKKGRWLGGDAPAPRF